MNSFRLPILLLFVINTVSFSQSSIIYSKSRGGLNTGGTLDLMIYNTETKKTKVLLKGTVGRRGEYNASCSPDNSKIIFNTYRYNGWKLAIGDFKNDVISNVEKLTDRSNYEYCGKFSPDGSKIVYQEYNWSTRDAEIFIANKDGRNSVQVFKPGISDQNLDWTRDSKSVVFTHANDEPLELYILSVDEQIIKKLSSHDANDFAPSTSKVTDQIAFLSDKMGKIDLFVANVDGSNLINLTSKLQTSDANMNSLWAYSTSWSPDGNQIVFNAMINGSFEIFTVDRDGSNLTQITDSEDTEITPYWMN